MTMEYGTITGRLVAAVADTTDDLDVNPDIVPISGTVTFTPSVKAILVVSEDITVVPAPIVAALDANGYVSLNGVQGVTVLATDSTYYNPTGWTYRVSFDNLSANGRRVTFDPYNIEVPVGANVDLSFVTPVQSSTGQAIVQGPKGDKGDTGATGPQGIPGNNVPTDTAVAGYLADPASQSGKIAANYATQFVSTASTPVATINTWLASAAPVKRLVGTVNITNAPLVIPSNTTLDATGATVTSTFVGNMVQNANAASATNRDSNIVIIGGTWQRNAGGPAATAADGSANGAHSIFLRHIDGLIVRGLRVGSTGGKYMIALGDVTNFRVSDITGSSLASDTVHMTGPASNGLVERVTVVSGGDDVVATTTTDYAAYSDVHGDITDITIRGVKGGNTTRTVLVAGNAYGATSGDGHTLDRIVIDTVMQTGSGAAVWTGAVGNTDTAGSIDISRVYGGPIQLRHPNQRLVTVCDAPRGIVVATQDANTAVNIGRMVLRDTTVAAGNFVLLNNAGIVIDHLELQNVSSLADTLVVLGQGQVKRLIVRSSYFAGVNNMITAGGSSSIGSMFIDAVTAAFNTTGTAFLRLNNSATVGTATFQDVNETAVDTNSGIAVLVSSTTATVASVIVNRGSFTGIGRFLEKASGTTGTTVLRLNDVSVSGANRLAQVGGGVLDFAYSNLRLSGTVNQPVRLYNSATGRISGNGWVGYAAGALATDSAAAVQCTAPDFPVDLSLLSKANGDRATNTNSALACGVGPAVSNGTNWKNLYSGTVY